MAARPKNKPVANFTKRTFRRLAGRDRYPQPGLINTRYPVVLMHGFGMLAVFLRGGHLHDEAMYLRERGVLAYAPNVSPYHTIPARAQMWKECLDHILKETGAPALNLIAHSMGGLDARYLISSLGFADQIRALVTVSTPHRGSCLADIVLERPERLQEWLSDVANWAGTSAMDGVDSDFRRAILELTPEYVTQEFNPAVQDHSDVAYFSYAGYAGKDTDGKINPLLRPQNILVYGREGVNDGFVSTASAEWGSFQGLIRADHSQQIGIDWTLKSSFKSTEFYADVVRFLSAQGF